MLFLPLHIFLQILLFLNLDLLTQPILYEQFLVGLQLALWHLNGCLSVYSLKCLASHILTGELRGLYGNGL